MFIGSADLMHRNLDRRVEALVRIVDPDHVAELLGLLELSVDDATASWHLGARRQWRRHHLAAEGGRCATCRSYLIARQRRRPAAAR